MENPRYLLPRNRLPEFHSWLLASGWEVATNTTGVLLKAHKRGRKHPIVIFEKLDREYLRNLNRDAGVIRAFLRSKKGNNNGNNI